MAAGLRSADAFTLRRCQIVLASARGERAPAIARGLGCSDQTVRNAIRAFEGGGAGGRSPRGRGRPRRRAGPSTASAPGSWRTRNALGRLGVGWKRARRRVAGPDPGYAR